VDEGPEGGDQAGRRRVDDGQPKNRHEVGHSAARARARRAASGGRTRRVLCRHGARAAHGHQVAPKHPPLAEGIRIRKVVPAEDRPSLPVHKVSIRGVAPAAVRHVECFDANVIVLRDSDSPQHHLDISVELDGVGVVEVGLVTPLRPTDLRQGPVLAAVQPHGLHHPGEELSALGLQGRHVDSSGRHGWLVQSSDEDGAKTKDGQDETRTRRNKIRTNGLAQ
jgi:hypothetical protein